MSMLYMSKAEFDSVVGVNATREDLSDTISLLTTRPRPISQNIGQVKATNVLHKWDEQPRNSNALASVTYTEGGTPGTNAIALNKISNKVCRQGLVAQVTDTMAAEWNGAGSWKLADGENARMLQEAIDYQVELVTMDVMDGVELMHLIGDQTNPGLLAGGATDGLLTWVKANGNVVATGGTTGTPVNFTETFIKDGARAIAEQYATYMPDTILVPPELIPDINGFVANGAGRPVVINQAAGPNGTNDLLAGVQVGYYNTGFSVLKIRMEPYLSPLQNSALVNPAVLIYSEKAVKQANLIPLGAEPLARTNTSVSKMVTIEYAQEHRVAKHTAVMSDVKSAIT